MSPAFVPACLPSADDLCAAAHTAHLPHRAFLVLCGERHRHPCLSLFAPATAWHLPCLSPGLPYLAQHRLIPGLLSKYMLSK